MTPMIRSCSGLFLVQFCVKMCLCLCVCMCVCLCVFYRHTQLFQTCQRLHFNLSVSLLPNQSHVTERHILCPSVHLIYSPCGVFPYKRKLSKHLRTTTHARTDTHTHTHMQSVQQCCCFPPPFCPHR